MKYNASENIMGSITKLDESMSKMVENDIEKKNQLYSVIRLQLENIEAKVETMIEKPGPDKDLEDLDDGSRGYLERVQSAEDWYDGLSAQEKRKPDKLRQYIGKRLRAIYWLLHTRGIYRVTSEYDAEDFDVIGPEEA